MCLAHQLDTQRAEQFSKKLIEVINMGSLAIMTSIGHRTGLFDTLSTLAPSTSTEIADSAGLNERYVREWLGAMVTGGIVECIPNDSLTRFFLPPEHAAFLTTAAAEDNIALFMQYIPLLSSVEDQIIDCFKHGGGVTYEAFGRFHEVMAEDSGQSVRSSLIPSIIPLVSGLHEDLIRGIKVLDIGCGMGRAINLMAKHYPNSQFFGYDFCREPIDIARKEAAIQRLTNVTFKIRDLTTFDVENPGTEFDLITAFDAIHDQAQPERVLAGVYRALKTGGTFLMQDIAGSSKVENNTDHPIGTFLYTISCMHCMSVSLAQDGVGLGAMWGEEKAKEMLNEAGFTSVTVKKLEHDFQNNYYIMQK